MKNKKIIIISCIVIVVILATICIILALNNNKQDADGKVLKIEFYDNASMGNTWKYDVDNKDIVSISSKTDYSGCEGRDGCSGKIIYSVKALKPGKVKITFKWINYDDELQDDAIYEITVDDDLSISEKHSGSYFEND